MKKEPKTSYQPPYRPALTAETREQQCIALAYDLAEQRLRDGTATSQEVCHFLKLGSPRERVERDILNEQKSKLKAQTKAIESQQHSEELYQKALVAFGRYAGRDAEDQETYEDV